MIEEKGFGVVVVEVDWFDVYWVNWYVCGFGEDINVDEVFSGFEWFFVWMWCNIVV